MTTAPYVRSDITSLRKGWFSNTSFTTGLKTLPTFQPDALVFFRAKTRASGRNVGKVFKPVVKLVLENQSFLMPEPAEKPSLHYLTSIAHVTPCRIAEVSVDSAHINYVQRVKLHVIVS